MLCSDPRKTACVGRCTAALDKKSPQWTVQIHNGRENARGAQKPAAMAAARPQRTKNRRNGPRKECPRGGTLGRRGATRQELSVMGSLSQRRMARCSHALELDEQGL